jgi:hypothetical protein
MKAKQRQTVDARIKKEKEKFIEVLKKNPVIQVVCERTGVSKATFYRWKSEDKEFSEKADSAMSEGNELVSDIAISQLISAIKDKNMHAIRYWLSNHHPDYKTKLEIAGSIQVEQELSPEQKALVEKALSLAGLGHG